MSVSQVVQVNFYNDTHFHAAQNQWLKLWNQKIQPNERIQNILKEYDLVDRMIVDLFEERVKRFLVGQMSRFQGWVQAEMEKEMAQWIYYFKYERKATLAELLPILNQASTRITKG